MDDKKLQYDDINGLINYIVQNIGATPGDLSDLRNKLTAKVNLHILDVKDLSTIAEVIQKLSIIDNDIMNYVNDISKT